MVMSLKLVLTFRFCRFYNPTQPGFGRLSPIRMLLRKRAKHILRTYKLTRSQQIIPVTVVFPTGPADREKNNTELENHPPQALRTRSPLPPPFGSFTKNNADERRIRNLV